MGAACLAAGLGEHEPDQELLAALAAAGLGPVHNMPVRNMSPAEAKRLQQVCSSPSQLLLAQVLPLIVFTAKGQQASLFVLLDLTWAVRIALSNKT